MIIQKTYKWQIKLFYRILVVLEAVLYISTTESMAFRVIRPRIGIFFACDTYTVGIIALVAAKLVL